MARSFAPHAVHHVRKEKAVPRRASLFTLVPLLLHVGITSAQESYRLGGRHRDRGRNAQQKHQTENKTMKRNTYILLQGMLVAALLVVAPSAGAQAQTTGVPGSPSATTTLDGRYLPNPPPPFGGVINLDATTSTPYWPPTALPPK